ncbi:MAG: hypothetical protein AAFU79_03740, partial [Myxococcota bacterium]
AIVKRSPKSQGPSPMADLVFGLTARFMLRFKMIEARDPVVSYVDRLSARPSVVRADALNAKIIEERGLARG